MTSNLGSNIIKEYAGKDKNKLESLMGSVLEKTFKPEFINRLDHIVYFDPLTSQVMRDIAKKELAEVEKILSEQNIKLVYSDDVALYFAEKGYDAVFGARPLKRLIEQEVLDGVAMFIFENKIKEGDEIRLKIKEGRICLESVSGN